MLTVEFLDDIEENILVFGLVYAHHFQKNEENDDKSDWDEPVDKQSEPEGSDQEDDENDGFPDFTEIEVLLNDEIPSRDELEDEDQKTKTESFKSIASVEQILMFESLLRNNQKVDVLGRRVSYS